MFKSFMFVVMVFGIAVAATAEMNPIEVLQSDAPLEDKVEACRLISVSGDVNAVPVLEPLLADEELSHMARYALEPMKSDEVGAALRRALQTTSGKLKSGIVASLGVRRDAAAVSELIPLLQDGDGVIVEAAARALGRIAAPEGVEALKTAIAQPNLSYAIAQALGEGLFFAAEVILENGASAEAVPLYDVAYGMDALPVHIRAAALRGAVLARKPQDGLPLVLEALQGDNPVFVTAVLRTVLEMEEPNRTANTLANLLPTLVDDRKIQVLQALGELGYRPVGKAVLAEVGSGTLPVRVAAIRTAVRLEHEPVLPVLAMLLSSGDQELAEAAREGISYFPGKAGDEAIMEMFKSGEAQIRLTAVELVSQGALPVPADLLMQVAKEDVDAGVRLAALKGAKDYVGSPHLAALIELLLAPRSDEEIAAAEEAIKLLCVREKGASKEDPTVPVALVEALSNAFVAGEGPSKLAVMRILSATGSPSAFEVVLPIALSGEGELKDTAVKAICDWPTDVALPTLLTWVQTPPGDTVKMAALRGVVRLLAPGQDTPENLCQQYATLMAQAGNANEKKLILSGLANIGHAAALNMVVEQVADEAVKAEAMAAAIAIAEKLGSSPEDKEALEKAKTLIPELGRRRKK
jgi:HEAT repeat protein